LADAKALLKSLEDLLGKENVVSDPTRIAAYFRPATEATGLIAAMPDSLEEVQGVVRLAYERKASILTVTDGYLPREDASRQGVVLDFRRMNTIDRLDKQNLLAHVWRGFSWDQFKRACNRAGVRMPTPVAATSESVLTNILGRNPLKQSNLIPEVNARSM
jgi:FAD/FMN-containing dehydrogenase